jgi:hypothetical protein
VSHILLFLHFRASPKTFRKQAFNNITKHTETGPSQFQLILIITLSFQLAVFFIETDLARCLLHSRTLFGSIAEQGRRTAMAHKDGQ